MSEAAEGGLERLARLVARLRAPDGCPWDREQRLVDLRAYLIEEAHEAAAALDAGDLDALGGELGDLLFQIVFVAAVAAEQGGPGAAESVARVEAKMIARHPHVFGDERLADAAAVRQAWERRKVASGHGDGLLAGVPGSLPALTQAYRMTQKAAGVGFDWPAAEAVLAKVREETEELAAELAAGAPATADPEARREALAAELGDLLFSVANLARHLGADPEAALARSNRKFRRRFQHIEARLREAGRSVTQATLEEMDALWEDAKAAEGARPRREGRGV